MKLKVYDKTLPPLPLFPSTTNFEYNQTKITRPEGYLYDEIFIVTRGSGILKIEGCAYELEENDMFYLRQGIPHEYFRTGETFITSYLSFFGTGINAIRDYYSIGNFKIYKNKNCGTALTFFKELFENFDSTQELSTLSAMAYRCVIAFFDEANKKEYTPIKRVYNYLEENYAKPLTLFDVLSVYPYSKTKLSIDFKSAYGKTIFDVLTDIRIRHAHQMILLNPYLPLKSISELSGYSDVSYFCKMYKKLLGHSPKNNRAKGR